jgi:predicted RND superfamily exporter protein
VDEALTRMGPTVLAGAVTTFGSGAVMFICALQFFFKMAVLICLTIVLSALFAILWLMALLAVIGPEDNTGDISFLTPCLGSDDAKEGKSSDTSGTRSSGGLGNVVAWDGDASKAEDSRVPTMSI